MWMIELLKKNIKFSCIGQKNARCSCDVGINTDVLLSLDGLWEVLFHIWTPSFMSLLLTCTHCNDVIMSAMASQNTDLTIVYSTIYSGVDKRKYQRSASLAFVCGIHRWPVNSPHKWPETRKMFPFWCVIMNYMNFVCGERHPPHWLYNYTA